MKRKRHNHLKHHNYKLTAVVLSISAAILYCLWFAGYWLNPSAMANFDVSALQSRGQPHYAFFVVGDIATGLLVALLVACLIKVFHRTIVHRKVSFWLCMIGLLAFGFMTAIACLLRSCDSNSYVCVQNLTQVFDLHDVTGAIASVGQFISLIGALILIRKTASHKIFATTLLLTIVWSITGLVFIVVSTNSLHFALFMQHLFLVLSSLCLVAVPWGIIKSKFPDSL
jgi:uncharacterized membrane protein